MKIIAMTNKKGGVGKTTTALSTAACLGQNGFSVLAIDMDAQGNFSQASGAKRNVGIFEFLRGAPPENCIQKMKKYDLLAAENDLDRAEKEFDRIGKEHLLEKALKRVKGYDYVILDTSPALNVMTMNAFAAADAVVVCCQTDSFSLAGLEDLMNNVELAKEYYNPNLTVAGILLTRYDNRTSISARTAEMFRARAKELHTKVFEAVIRESVAIKESQLRQCDVFDYSVGCHAAEDYTAFTKELFIAMGGDKKKWAKGGSKQNTAAAPKISIPRQTRKRPLRRR